MLYCYEGNRYKMPSYYRPILAFLKLQDRTFCLIRRSQPYIWSEVKLVDDTQPSVLNRLVSKPLYNFRRSPLHNLSVVYFDKLSFLNHFVCLFCEASAPVPGCFLMI